MEIWETEGEVILVLREGRKWPGKGRKKSEGKVFMYGGRKNRREIR